MIQEISKRLLTQLENDLQQTCSQVKDPLQRLTTVLKLIREALKRLRAHVNDLKFGDKSEEIPIFKYIKPSFYQWQIYYTELYNIETNLPYGDAEKQAGFLEQELLYIERFFRQYAFLNISNSLFPAIRFWRQMQRPLTYRLPLQRTLIFS